MKLNKSHIILVIASVLILSAPYVVKAYEKSHPLSEIHPTDTHLNMSNGTVSYDIYGVNFVNASEFYDDGTSLTSKYIDASGDSMSGDLDLGGNNITNVDYISSNYLSGVTVLGNLNLGGNNLTNVNNYSLVQGDIPSLTSTWGKTIDAELLTDLTDLNNKITLMEQNITNENWIEDSQESNLDVNSSNYWDNYNTPSEFSWSGDLSGTGLSPSVVDNSHLLDWANITNKVPSDFNYKILIYPENVTNENWVDEAGDQMSGNLVMNSNDIKDIYQAQLNWRLIGPPDNDVWLGVNSSGKYIGLYDYYAGANAFRYQQGGNLEAFTNLNLTGNNITELSNILNFFSGSCSDNQHITGISSDGTISCGSDSGDISAVTAGNQLTGGGSSGSVTLGVSEGSGSGLDADLLDGQDGSYYLDDTDTNASTACTGTDTFLSGDGTCEPDSYAPDTNAATECTGANVYLAGDGTCDSDIDTTVDGCLGCLAIGTEVTDPGGLSDGDDYAPDTNAATECSAGQYLDGDGTCYDEYDSSDDGDTNSTNELQDLVSHCIADTDGNVDSCADECSANGWICVDVIRNADNEPCSGGYPAGGSDAAWGCGKASSTNKLCQCLEIT